jgi:DNA-directed RNA polymerase
MIREQIKWERECVERGSQRYLFNQDKLKDMGRGYQTDAAKFLFKKRLKGIAGRIEKLANRNVGLSGKYNRVLKSTAIDGDYMKVAYVGAQCTFIALTGRKPSTLLHVVLAIAKRLEADLKCALFEAEYPGYYHTVVRSLEESQVGGYEHKHNVLMTKFKHFDIAWEPWTPKVKMQIGSKVFRCIMEEYWDVLFISKKTKGTRITSMVETTPIFDDWLAEFENERGFLLPELLPLKCKPVPWTELKVGGYYTPQMRNALPFVKTKTKDHRAFVEQHVPKRHMEGVNKLQNTAWKINLEVLKVQQQIYKGDLGIGVPSKLTVVPPPFPEHLKGDKLLYTDLMKNPPGRRCWPISPVTATVKSTTLWVTTKPLKHYRFTP